MVRMRNTFSRIDDELDSESLGGVVSVDEISHLVAQLKEEFSSLEVSVQQLIMRSQSSHSSSTRS